MTEDNTARLRRAGVAACHCSCAGGHSLSMMWLAVIGMTLFNNDLICVRAMADLEEIARLLEARAALFASLVHVLQGVHPAPALLQRFFSHPESTGKPTIDEWLIDLYLFVRQCGVPEGERAVVLADYLGGCAKEEVLCHPEEVRLDFGALLSLLRRVFGPWETVTSLNAEFYARMQSQGETS